MSSLAFCHREVRSDLFVVYVTINETASGLLRLPRKARSAYKSSNKSTHSGLTLSIPATFYARLQLANKAGKDLQQQTKLKVNTQIPTASEPTIFRNNEQ